MKWHRCVSVMAGLMLVLTVSAARAEVITHGGTTINMDFVTIGNAGNAADDTGYGAVGYDYRIGKYEVTAAQWAAVIAADPNVGDAGNWSGSQPTAGTSWYEAARFCNWLSTGNANSGVYNTSTWAIMDRQTAVTTFGTAYFIPTENEWYKAAYYDPNKSGEGVGGYWDYPTEHDSPNVPDGIDSAEDTAFDAVFYDGHDQSQPNSVDNAGVLSAYGTMGQGGNVWEWNETLVTGVVQHGNRGLRGGHWGSLFGFSEELLLASARESWSPEYAIYGISGHAIGGFRVASVPEPGSLTLMLFGALAGLYWWRRRK